MPTAPIKYSVYRFKQPYTKSLCKTWGGNGISGCLEFETFNLRVGDKVVVMGQSGSYSSDPETGEQGVNGQVYGGGMNGAMTYIPTNVLTLISENLDGSQIAQYTTNNQEAPSPGSGGGLSSFIFPSWLKVVGGIVIIGLALKGIQCLLFHKKA